MSHTPEQQWSALSALYEEADALPPHALPAWLARLETQRHPLLPQLKRMLEARAHLETDDFLGTLPRLSARDAPGGSDWAPGRRVGPYRLVRPLGEGGMAEVWLADRDDGVFKRQVAIKLPYPRPGRETFAVRFDRERNILASLRHPHIAALYDAGVTAEGQAWLALEYVEGQPISAFCDERRLPVRDRVVLFRQVLLAVQHAHANLVIHRDLKPVNILVTPQGEARLLDFGIAKLLEAEGDSIAETELTRQAGRSMTPRYASPEQLTGQPLTIACDVYQLGVVFYELICGEQPYELKVASPAQLEHAILETDPRAPSRRNLTPISAESRGTTVKALRRTLSPELDAIALRCLTKKPSGRYSSVDALLADVDRWLAGEAVLARSPGAWWRFAKFAARHRVGVGLGLAAVLSLVAATTVAIVLGLQAREESARAVSARDFMLNLFKHADQEKSRGADITARELLQRGRADVMKRLAGQPRLQAELLGGIASVQLDMGEYVHADSTFAEVVRIYSDLGLNREAALATVAHANNAMRAGNLARAESLLRQATELAGRRDNDHELNARRAEVDGWIAYLQNDAQRARTLFAESRRHAIAAFGPHHVRTLEAVRGLIHAERKLHNHDGALALMSELESMARRTPDIAPKDIVALGLDRADLLYESGRYAQAVQYLAVAIPDCTRAVGPNDELCLRMLVPRARAMLRLGQAQQVRSDTAQLEALANDTSSPTLQIDALLTLLRLESMLGASQRHLVLLERVRAFGLSGAEVAVNPALKSLALLSLAEAKLMTGDPVDARRWIEKVLATPSNNSAPAPILSAVAKSLLGVSFLLSDDGGQALQWLREGHDELMRVRGADHPMTQLFSLNLALALHGAGQTGQAREIVQRAEPILLSSLGSSAPTFIRVQRLKARLLQAHPKTAGADAPASANPGTGTRAPIGLDFFS
ncbi:serine/threonine-protein kinase [Piscinibacter sp. XHJ-5]|uniref:serine/threonine-protein kinase n=1 Tax=Piscinibacter sp. XHJ-5 TaxID=3037797 RepID=UPI002453577D|nr:serine/threonine-protein kinase [Piscinibacter sp. XHJ-5]